MSGAVETYIRCPVCLQKLTYCKVTFYRKGWFDWRLDVWCGCGDVTDPALRKAVRDFYGEQLAREIATTQEAALVQMIGPRLNDWLNAVSRRGAGTQNSF